MFMLFNSRPMRALLILANGVFHLVKEMRINPVDVTFKDVVVRHMQHPYDDVLMGYIKFGRPICPQNSG